MFPIVQYLSLENIMIAVGVFLIIVGIPMSFSKKERERIQKRVMTELPDRSATLGSPEAIKIYQRRGYITLAVGILLVIGGIILINFK